MKPLRILFIGNHAAPHSTESDIRKTLIAMGHYVLPVQEGPRLKWVPMADAADGVAAARGFDVTIWMHTHGWDWDAADEFLAQTTSPTVAITLDLFRGLARHDPKYVETHPWFKCKYFFQPDEPDWLRARGVNAYFSPPGVLGESCYVSPLNPKHEAYRKVVFVGSKNYHPEWPWRAQLIEFLEETYRKRFVLYTHDSGLRGDRLNQVYANAGVVVGDSCFASPDSTYTSDRLFETLGRGGNLLYPAIKWRGLDAHLRDLVWTDYTPGELDQRRKIDLRRKIDDGLRFAFDEDWRSEAEEASAYIRAAHSYEARMERILETVAREEGWS